MIDLPISAVSSFPTLPKQAKIGPKLALKYGVLLHYTNGLDSFHTGTSYENLYSQNLTAFERSFHTNTRLDIDPRSVMFYVAKLQESPRI